MKKNIIMIPYPELGAQYVANLAQALNNEGIKVLKPKNLIIFPFLFPLLRNVLGSNINILHMHWIEGFAGLSAKNILWCVIKFFFFLFDTFVVRFVLKIKLVWTIHNLYSHENLYPKIEKLSRKYFARISNAVICHCNYAKQLFHKEFAVSKDKIYVIKIGNYLKSYKNTISQEQARHILNLKKEDFIFLVFGPLRPYKGILYLINSFKKIQTNDHLKLLIVGKPESTIYQQLIFEATKSNQNIILVPNFIPNDEIQNYINAADIIVFSYKKILTSAGILLAMSFNKPIIAPKLGCIPETINDQGAFLYDPSNKMGLNRALEETVKNENKLEEMGKYNYLLAKNHEWDLIAKQNKKIYQGFSK